MIRRYVATAPTICNITAQRDIRVTLSTGCSVLVFLNTAASSLREPALNRTSDSCPATMYRNEDSLCIDTCLISRIPQ